MYIIIICVTRYQGEEGWAPAMHLKRVNSDDSVNAEDSTLDQLNIVSNDDGTIELPSVFL